MTTGKQISLIMLGSALLGTGCSESPPTANATRVQPVFVEDPAKGAYERMQNMNAELNALVNMSEEERSFRTRNRERLRREDRNRPCGPDNPC